MKSHTPFVLALVALTACEGAMPPPPVLRITTPERGMIQQQSGKVTVKGTALPNSEGDPVTRVTVNNVPAKLELDGSFVAVVDVVDGATLLETIATSEYGGMATDARAVQSGARVPVGTMIDRAVMASLSKEAFARLSTVAGTYIKNLDLAGMLAPQQPMANVGDSIANVRLSITNLAFADVKISLVPTNGGLQFSAEIDGLSVSAKADYAGALVPDGSTTVNASTDKITIAGMLVVTPAGENGFTTTIASPSVQTTALHLNANGLVGRVLQLVNDNLGSTIQKVATKAAEGGLSPLLNKALGGLAGPKQFDILGKHLTLQASPNAVTFTNDGALVAVNLQTLIGGSEASPGFINTPNGTPMFDPTAGVQLGISDDLLNEMLAEIHALGLLDIHQPVNAGVFDMLDIKLAMPPMVNADNDDGSLRLILGDMIATVSNQGKPLVGAAVNALVDLTILPGTEANQVALKFGDVRIWVNALAPTDDGGGEYDISGAAATGIGIQLDSLQQFLVTVPVPTVAGVSLDGLEMHADSGYMLVSGDIK